MPLSNPPKKQEILDLITAVLADNSTITAAEHRSVENAITNAIFDRTQIGDIKEIAYDPNSTYLVDNFEISGANAGRGKVGSVRYGWALCNGLNGTLDKRGRVSVGINPQNFGGTNSNATPLYNIKNGVKGGSETVSLTIDQIPPHNHTFEKNSQKVGTGNSNGLGNSGTGVITTTSDTGGNGLSGFLAGANGHTNMQPYIISVFIQKIAETY